MRVDRAHVERVAEDGEPAIVQAAAGTKRVRWHSILVDPEHAAGSGIERHDVVWRLHHIHDAVDDERRRLHALRRLRLEDPFQFQVSGIGRRDLIEQAVAPASIVPGERQPVLRFLLRTEEAFIGHLLRAYGSNEQDGAETAEKQLGRDVHWWSPGVGIWVGLDAGDGAGAGASGAGAPRPAPAAGGAAP